MRTKHLISSHLGDERGQALVEYALIITLVALGAAAALTPIGVAISDILMNVAGAV